MKRTPLIRRTRLVPSGPLPTRGRTKEKKRARYAAYLRSPEWKARRAACIEAAGGQCEFIKTVRVDEYDGAGYIGIQWHRCTATTRLTAHHKTYVRFGHELPEDLICYCRTHHDYIEHRDFPHRRRSA